MSGLVVLVPNKMAESDGASTIAMFMSSWSRTATIPVLECFDTLHGSKWFNAIDLNAGYYQIEVDEGDCEKTAFITKHGLFQYRSMLL